MSAKSEAVKKALTANPEFSNRKIAAACGVSHVTVGRVRWKYFPSQKERTGMDGKTRTTPLSANADLIAELNESLSRAETILKQIKHRLSTEKPKALTFAEIWAGNKSMLPPKTRAALIRHLKAQAKRIDHAFGDAIYRH